MTRVVHVKQEPFDVYIGRWTPDYRENSPYSNPFKIGRDGTREQVIEKFREHVRNNPELLERAKRELKGRTLGCWCKPKPCHGDVWVELLDGEQETLL